MPKRFLLGIAAALLLPSPAAAQPRPVPAQPRPVPAQPTPVPAQPTQGDLAETASDLAYRVCPLFLAGRFPLTAPVLAERGFGTAIQKRDHPSFGELQTVSARRSDGEISFGGLPGKVCVVVATGGKREAALAKLRGNMFATGFAFEPVPHSGPEFPDMTIETFRAPVQGHAIYLQLIQARGATPSVTAQIFALAK
ncbi:MAG TPA: hypothetical protein VGB04_14055 [Allosphingosinicella sp.]|jgi:hypothetical protein